MATTQNAPMVLFNRGLVDSRFLTRTEIRRVAFAAEEYVNFVPRSGGSMTLRPGMEFIGSTHNDNEPRHIPFIRSALETAIIELTDSVMRIRVDEDPVERFANSSTITNGGFDTDLTGWTDADETGATSRFVAGGFLGLVGTLSKAAIRRQQVTVLFEDVGVQHGLKIVIDRGPVTFKVGSTVGGSEFIPELTLRTGEYSLAFTPSGDFHIEFSAHTQWEARVDSIAVEAAGPMTIVTSWQLLDLANIRTTQSIDVNFIAADGQQQRRIERLGIRSWGVVLFEPEDGPFRAINITDITLTPGALTGDTTLTASRDYFNADHVGALFQISTTGQRVEQAFDSTFAAASILINGVSAQRDLTITISGTWEGTILLEKSVDDQTTFTTVQTYSDSNFGVIDLILNDGLDNQIIHYRFRSPGMTSGTAFTSLATDIGSVSGVVRVREFTSTTVVNISILSNLSSTDATDLWREGLWSNFRGFPNSVALYEGRLWWAGNDRIVGSVSDGFENYNPGVAGDAGPINRTIGAGPIAFISWLLPLQRLLFGTDISELSVRSTTFDEILTPTNFNLKEASTQGSNHVNAVKVDTLGIFVQAAGLRVNELRLSLEQNDYQSRDLTILNPDIGDPGFIHLAAQRQPDTRLHFLRSNGTVAMLLFIPTEEAEAWLNIETGDADGNNGVIEDAFVMPGNFEDVVYYSVKRIINGETKRYLEKWALEADSIGGDPYNDQADSFRMFINNPASATVTGYDHLEGEKVVVWAEGKALRDTDGEIATFTVSGGSITLTNNGVSFPAKNGIVGLPYRARFKSGKLPYAVNLGTPLSQKQRISSLSLICVNTHNQGLKFGRDFTNMNNLPRIIEGAKVDVDTVHSFLDEAQVTFPGNADIKSRLFLEANAPRPATITAAVLGLTTYERKS